MMWYVKTRKSHFEVTLSCSVRPVTQRYEYENIR